MYTQLFNLFNFNFNYQHTTRFLDCGEYIYKNYTLYECTCHCITQSVTAHPDDGQTRPKHVAATN